MKLMIFYQLGNAMRNVILIMSALTVRCFAMDATTHGLDECGIEDSKQTLVQLHVNTPFQSLTCVEILEKNNTINAEIYTINERLLNEDLTSKEYLGLKKKRTELELSRYQYTDKAQMSDATHKRYEDLEKMIWDINKKLAQKSIN